MQQKKKRTESTTIQLKTRTIKKLDEILLHKVKGGDINILKFIKTKRGVSYDDEIYHITDFYLKSINAAKTDKQLATMIKKYNQFKIK